MIKSTADKIRTEDFGGTLVVKKFYGENELRRMYLDFFESKGHLKNEQLFIGTTQ